MVEARTASIASHVPGRLRLRHGALRRPAVNAEVATTIAEHAGVVAATGNARTAGVLVLYDPAVLSSSEAEGLGWECLAAAAGLAVGEPAEGGPDLAEPVVARAGSADAARASARTRFATAYRKVRVPVNIAMLATLGGSLLALAVGRKAHAALGVAHLGVLALHLTQYRRRLVS